MTAAVILHLYPLYVYLCFVVQRDLSLSAMVNT